MPVASSVQTPELFKGSLKGYQLKGLQWLVNCYEQVECRSMTILVNFKIDFCCLSTLAGFIFSGFKWNPCWWDGLGKDYPGYGIFGSSGRSNYLFLGTSYENHYWTNMFFWPSKLTWTSIYRKRIFGVLSSLLHLLPSWTTGLMKSVGFVLTWKLSHIGAGLKSEL